MPPLSMLLIGICKEDAIMLLYYAMKNCRKNLIFVLAVLIVLSISACGKPEPEPIPTVNPYEGMVSVSDGMQGLMWVPLHEEIAACSLDYELFAQDGEYISYLGDSPKTMRGIDVSEHQREIDWQMVAADGVEFAMIRVGYRGYTEGKIREDAYFRQNIEGAKAAGIKVGIYFFSQAITVQEAREEAEFVLSLISDYEIDFPVAFDWEIIGGDEQARTDGLDNETLTDCALVFCSIIENAGYESSVYFYRRLGYFEYDLSKLAHLTFWVGAPGELPDFYYEHDIWQYSFTGNVNGIEGDVDLNIYFKHPESST